jgi:hypothetical protein
MCCDWTASDKRLDLLYTSFFSRTALSRAVSPQLLIGSAGGGDFDTKPPLPSSKAPSASGGAAAGEAAHSAILLQTSQLDAVLRVNADLHQKLLEQERKVNKLEQEMKYKEQRKKEQGRAIAAVQQQSAQYL